MGKAPAFQFYPGDWIQDTRILTPLTRGIWIDMLCFMWRSSERGKVEGTHDQLARMLSCEKSEIEKAISELSVTKIADVTQRNDFVTVINRRMFREEKVRKQTRSRVNKFRNADVKRESNGLVTDASSSSSSFPPKAPQICNAENATETPDNGNSNRVPYGEIRKIWIEVLPELPRPRDENKTWYPDCKARWLQYEKCRDLQWWRAFFDAVRKNPHWMGENERRWKPEIGWFMKQKNFFKVIERT